MMKAMSTLPRSLLVFALMGTGLLAVACSPSSDAATSTATETATEEATSGVLPTATSELPDWVSTRLDSGDLDGDGTLDALVRYVGGTGGGGVSHRSACETDARLDGTWPEGTRLEVVAADTGTCEGWTLTTDGDVTSWVLDKYLTETKPATAGSGGAGGGGSTGGGGGGGPVQVLLYGANQWAIPLASLRIAEVGETWCTARSWHDPDGGDYVVKLADGTPFVNPDPRGCGFGRVGEVTIAWVSP
jgi:hypothetical protein